MVTVQVSASNKKNSLFRDIPFQSITQNVKLHQKHKAFTNKHIRFGTKTIRKKENHLEKKSGLFEYIKRAEGK